MNIIMICRIAFRALMRNKARAALTMLGVIIGVAAVIAMVSIGQGAQASVNAQIESIGTNLLFVTAGASNTGGVRSGTADLGRRTLTIDDVNAIKQEIPTVAKVSPVVSTRSQIVFGNANWNTSVQGVSDQFQDIRKWTIQSGVFISDSDVQTDSRVIVLGQTVANNLFSGTDPVGQSVRVMNLPFRIIGVMGPKGQDAQGRDQDDIAFAPYTTVQKKLLAITYVQSAYVSAISADATYTAQTQIAALLRQRHKIAPNEDDDFFVRNQADIAATADATNGIMTLLLGSIAGVSRCSSAASAL